MQVYHNFTCLDAILELPFIKKRASQYVPDFEEVENERSLLKTIKVPKNLMSLTDRLPAANYEEDEDSEELEALDASSSTSAAQGRFANQKKKGASEYKLPSIKNAK
jgi:hypothetical protein